MQLTKLFLTAMLMGSAMTAFAQYPTIPDSVKERGAREDAQWAEQNDRAWQKALPTVMDDMLYHGKPFVPQASQPSDLKQAQIAAFPGAEGGGKYSFGGRGVNYLGAAVESKVYVVTSLADSGKGTLREACEAGGPRVVVFNVSGEIKLKRPINIIAPYITIAGQTAPGDGVVVTGETMEVDTHDVIIRFMRFRRGAMDVAHRDDACGGNGIGNIIYDHCSASWGLDEVMSMYRHVYARWNKKQDKMPTVNITIQDCMFAQGMDLYNHAFGASIGGHNTLFARNLFADNISRNPSIAMDGDFNFVNNVLFNWWNRSIDGGDNNSQYNIINNYFKPGPITGFNAKADVNKALKAYVKALKKGNLLSYYNSEYASGSICYRVLKPEHGRSKEKQDLWGKAYVGGNYVVGFPAVTEDNWAGGVQPAFSATDSEAQVATSGNEYQQKVRQFLKVDTPFKYNAPEKVMTAEETYDYVLANVGATLPKRDAIDELVIRGVKAGVPEYAKDAKVHVSPYSKRRLPDESYKLGIITDPQQVGGLPEYRGVPRIDSDGDGMPDDWEKAHGLNPNDASDATKIGESGYMNVELYINDLEYFSLSPLPLSNLPQQAGPSPEGGEASFRVSCCDWMMLKRQKLGEFQLSKDVGADGVEMDMGPLGRRVLFENRFRDNDEETAKFRRTADSLGVKVSSVAMSGFFAQTLIDRSFNEYTKEDGTKECYPHSKAESIANYVALFNDCFDTMDKFGAKVAFLPLGGSGKEWQSGKGEVYDTLCARLRMVGDMAARRGVVVGIRTAMPAEFGIKMLKDIKSEGIKIYYNLQDACDNGWDICKELKLLGNKRICQIHCSNTDSVTLRNDPEVDLPKIIKTLKQIGYKGWLTVERSRNAKDVRNVKGNYGDNVMYIKEVANGEWKIKKQ